MRNLETITALVKEASGANGSLSFVVCEHSLSQLWALGQINETLKFGMYLSGMHDSIVEKYETGLVNLITSALKDHVNADEELRVTISHRDQDCFDDFSDKVFFINVSFFKECDSEDHWPVKFEGEACI